MRLIDADALRKNAQHAKDISKWDGELLVVGLGHILSAPTIESPRPDWTSCADRLPDEAKPCYITTKRTLKDGRSTVGVFEGYLFKGNWFDKAGWKIKNWDCEAIAWQYNIVPEPYNPDRKEDAK